MQLTKDVTKHAREHSNRGRFVPDPLPSSCPTPFSLPFRFFVSYPFSSRFSNALRVVLIVSSNSRYGEGWSRFIDHRAKTGHAPQMETYAVNPLARLFLRARHYYRVITRDQSLNNKFKSRLKYAAFFFSYVKRRVNGKVYQYRSLYFTETCLSLHSSFISLYSVYQYLS